MPVPGANAHSEEVDDILGAMPSWFTRAGSSALWAIFLGLVALSWVIRYPDAVPARVTITTEEPPARLMARSSGRLERLLVSDGAEVKRGAWLGVLENPADPEDVLRLEAMLAEVQKKLHDPDQIAAAQVELPGTPRLGSLQLPYAALVRSVLAYRLFRAELYDDRKLDLVGSQLSRHRQIGARLRKQVEIVEGDVARAAAARDRMAKLRAEGLASVVDMEAAENVLQQKRLLVDQAQANLQTHLLQGQELEKGRVDLRRDRDERGQELELGIQEACKRLESELVDWEQRFVLEAPIDGRVALHEFWSDHQFVEEGREVMAVLPAQSHLIGRVELGQRGMGKVSVGQRVHVKLDGYPFHQYGVLEGRVSAISPLAHGDAYLLQVAFDAGLRTSFGRALDLKDGMQGSADIVTEDARLIERILQRVLYAVTQP